MKEFHVQGVQKVRQLNLKVDGLCCALVWPLGIYDESVRALMTEPSSFVRSRSRP